MRTTLRLLPAALMILIGTVVAATQAPERPVVSPDMTGPSREQPSRPRLSTEAEPTSPEVLVAREHLAKGLAGAASSQSFKFPQDPADKKVRGTIRTAPQATVLCGLTMWEADPQVDSKIRLPARTDRDFKLRKITPPACTIPVTK